MPHMSKLLKGQWQKRVVEAWMQPFQFSGICDLEWADGQKKKDITEDVTQPAKGYGKEQLIKMLK